MLQRKRAEDRQPGQPGRIRRAGRWYMQSTGTLVASGLLLLVLAAGAVYLAVVPPATPSAASGRPTAAPAGDSAGPAAQDGPDALAPGPGLGLCPAQDPVAVAPESVVLAMYDTHWDQLNGALVPSSQTGGPINTGAPRTCFARTPEGALYSLASFFIEVDAAPDTAARVDLIQARASRGGAYQQLMDQLQTAPSIADTPAGQPLVRLTGYRWLGYTPDTAQLELQYQRLSGPQANTPVRTTVQAAWESNDWLVVVPTQDTVLHQPGSEQTTYTPWGPPA